MADLNVQPKKKSLFPWILLALGILILVFFLFRGCDNKTDETNTVNTDTSTATRDAATNTVAATTGWEGINYDAPTASYEEITNRDIEVRSDDRFAIYSLGENILFDVDKSAIRTQAEPNLKQIAESIAKRYGSGEVRVYGYTDAVGSKSYNKELAEDRAKSVREWLVQNGNIGDNRISVVAVGEARPAATNATSEGRQQNRRVEIIVKRS